MNEVLLFICFLQVLLDIKNKSPFVLFTISSIFVVVLPHLTFVVPGVKYQNYVYDEATLYMVVFFSIYFVCSLILSSWLRFNKWFEFDSVNISMRSIYMLMLFNMASVAFFVYGISKFNLYFLLYADWWSVVHSNSSVTLLASYFSYATSSLALMCMFDIKNRFIIVSYCIFYIAFTVFILKTRGYLVAFLAPVFLYYLYSCRYTLKSKLINISASVFGILFLFVFTRMVRHGGDLSSVFLMDSSDFASLFESATSDGAEFNLINSFYLFIETGINKLPEEFGRFDSIRRIMFFFLPTGFLDLKPAEFSYVMHNVFFGSSQGSGLSLHPTIVGEAFANGGLLGVVIYPILIVVVFSFITKWILNSSWSYFYIGPASVLSLFLARGALYNAFVFFIGSILVVLFVILLLKFKVGE